MPARKHNMFVIKLLSVIVGIVSTGIAVFTVDWAGVIKFGHSVNFLYDNVDELEHVLDDYHTVLGLGNKVGSAQEQLDSLKQALFITTSRDSLIHVLELMNRGKLPYDSIWRKSESGHWYLTTIKYHYDFEHND